MSKLHLKPHKHMANQNVPTVVETDLVAHGGVATVDPIPFDVYSAPEFPATNDEPYTSQS